MKDHIIRKHRKANILTIAVTITMLISVVFQASAQEKKHKTAKNIIFLIGDGMGYNHIKAGGYYLHGKEGELRFQQFPVLYGMSTYSAELDKPLTSRFNDDSVSTTAGGGYCPAFAWSSFAYLKSRFTDSAPAATAMSTGFKTYNASIGMDMNRKPLKHFSQAAKEYGKSTGVITTVPFSHATPAGFSAHNIHRNNYSQIAAEMLLDTRHDVIMGGGNPGYDENAMPLKGPWNFKLCGDSTMWFDLLDGKTDVRFNGAINQVEDADGDGKPDPWLLIQEVEDFRKFGAGDAPKRLFGVPKAAQTLHQARTGKGDGTPYSVPLNPGVPTLKEMTLAAINVLDDNSKGFFLMIEGGAIDWASHANQSDRLLEEFIDFNNAVDAVIDWVETNSSWDETLVIVTGDHETGLLWGPNSGGNVFNPIVNNGKGKVPGMEWHSTNHTNSLIAVYAKGAGSHMFHAYADEYDPVRGRFINNTEIPQVFFRLLENEQ